MGWYYMQITNGNSSLSGGFFILPAKRIDKMILLSYHKEKGGVCVAEIIFYMDKNGNEPIPQYMRELAAKTDKDSRIKLNKILEYIEILAEHGTRVGVPYVKHLEGDIWELRPGNVRILFTLLPNGYVLLHNFIKKTQKTPRREIDKAKKEIAELMSDI